MRIRALVNAEVVAEHPNGTEYNFQFGAHTYVSANRIDIYEDDGEKFADIYLVNGDKVMGVAWGPEYFENHGVPEFNIKPPKPPKMSVEAIKKEDKVILRHLNDDEGEE